MSGARIAFALALACSQPACQDANRAPQGPPPSTPAAGPVLRFSYEAIDGRSVSSASLANRVSVIGFLTTYDVHSQAEARYLSLLEHHHSPRVNVTALMLEAPENRPLVEAFAVSLGLTFPIAIADAPTIAGEGPFSGLHHVPSVVVLDRWGREAWRHIGFVSEQTLEAAVRAVESSSPPARDPSVDGGD